MKVGSFAFKWITLEGSSGGNWISTVYSSKASQKTYTSELPVKTTIPISIRPNYSDSGSSAVIIMSHYYSGDSGELTIEDDTTWLLYFIYFSASSTDTYIGSAYLFYLDFDV